MVAHNTAHPPPNMTGDAFERNSISGHRMHAHDSGTGKESPPRGRRAHAGKTENGSSLH